MPVPQGDITTSEILVPEVVPLDEAIAEADAEEATRKNPSQGKFKSGFSGPRPATKIDTNKHGIRRETVLGQKNCFFRHEFFSCGDKVSWAV